MLLPFPFTLFASPAHSPHRLPNSIFCASDSKSSPHVLLTAGKWPPPSLRGLWLPSLALMLFYLHPTYHHLSIHPYMSALKIQSYSCEQAFTKHLLCAKQCGQRDEKPWSLLTEFAFQRGRPSRWPVQTVLRWQKQKYVHGTGAT